MSRQPRLHESSSAPSLSYRAPIRQVKRGTRAATRSPPGSPSIDVIDLTPGSPGSTYVPSNATRMFHGLTLYAPSRQHSTSIAHQRLGIVLWFSSFAYSLLVASGTQLPSLLAHADWVHRRDHQVVASVLEFYHSRLERQSRQHFASPGTSLFIASSTPATYPKFPVCLINSS